MADVIIFENARVLKSGVSGTNADLSSELDTNNEGEYVLPIDEGTNLNDLVVEIVPNISNFSVQQVAGGAEISFESDEELGDSAGDIAVPITDSNGNTETTLGRTDFTESGSDPWTYTATYQPPTQDDYTATLNAAKDPRGNDGASGESGTATAYPPISSFTFDADPNNVQDGDDVTFTVPGDGAGDAYTVKIYDVDTGVVFTTLSWTGSKYEGTVTINGTEGDDWTFEAEKERGSDGATKRSDNQETVQIISFEPVAAYAFEGGALGQDDAGSNTLTINGGGARAGLVNQEYGVSKPDYADGGDVSAFEVDGDFHIATAVYLDSAKGNSWILSKRGGAENEFQLVVLSENFGIDGKDNLSFQIWTEDGSFAVNYQDVGQVSDNTRYLIHAWVDTNSKEVAMQVNNGPVEKTSYTGTPNVSDSSFRVGERVGASSSGLDGGVDTTFIYKFNLSSQKRTNLYNNGNWRDSDYRF